MTKKKITKKKVRTLVPKDIPSQVKFFPYWYIGGIVLMIAVAVTVAASR